MIVTTLALKYTWLLVVITYITCTSVHATTCLPDAVITEHPSTVVAALNSSVSFTCSGYRYIIWKVNNIQIKSNEAQTAASARGIFANIDDQNSSQLFMFASLINNNTKIQCFVRVNQLATNCLSSRIARLYVYGSPHPPSNLTISQLGFDLSLSWEATFSLKGENITYIVRVTNTRSRESREIESDLPQLVLSESIGERDCSLYEFRVYSVNPVGRSTTSIHDTVRIPTEPLVLQSVDVFVDVSLEKGVSVTLSFNAPKPCSSYQVISYNVTFTDRIKSVPSLNSSASDSFFITEYWNNFDFVVLTVDNQTTSIKKDKAYLVAIEARNIAGSMISEPVKVYTTGLQSSSVVLEVNDTASVTCNFALGSDALGCEVSFYVSTSMELLFAQNITREPSSGNTLTKNIPLMGSLDGSTVNITVLTSEWLADGSVSLVEIEAQVIKAQVIEPDKTTEPTSHTQTTDQSLSAVLLQPTKRSNDVVYIFIGSILGSVLVILLLCVTVVVFGIIIVMRKRRGSVMTFSDSHMYDRKKNRFTDDARSTNSYISKDCSNSSPFSPEADHGPHYSEIADPKTVALSDDPYVLMQNNAKIQFTATNSMYVNGIDRDNAPGVYEEIELTQEKGKTSLTQEGPVIYDEVKLNPDGVKLRGNESYGAVGTPTA